MTTAVAIPELRQSRRWTVPVVTAVAVVALAAGGTSWWVRHRGVATAVAGAYYTVQPMDLVITIRKDGDLQAVNNIDINCEVEGQARIQTIVKEGTVVKKGDVMVTLDSAEIDRKLQDAKLQLQKYDTDLTRAKEDKVIQDQKNTADLETAEVEHTLAKLDLQEYKDGKYPQSVRESERAVKMGEISLKNKQEEFEQTNNLYLKGFKELAEVKRAEVDVLQAENDLDKKKNDLEVLTKYTFEKESTDRQNKLKQSERKLLRVKKENSSNTAQKEAAVTAAEEALKAQKYLVEHLEKQLAACTVKAPSDGLVVYGSTGSNYYWRERPIQAGAQINQQELLIRLPDTSKMKASVKVPESWIGKLRDYEKHPMTAKVEIVGVREPVTAKVTSVSVMADNSQRWWTDAKEYPVELTLDTTPPSLKPGISATATIFVEKLPEVLAVPLTTVYSVGADRYVFVKERGQTMRPVKVTLGQSNDTHVEIKEGISRGQELLVLQVGQGRELLEKAGINVSDGPGGGAGATTKPSEKQPGPAVAEAK